MIVNRIQHIYFRVGLPPIEKLKEEGWIGFSGYSEGFQSLFVYETLDEEGEYFICAFGVDSRDGKWLTFVTPANPDSVEYNEFNIADTLAPVYGVSIKDIRFIIYNMLLENDDDLELDDDGKDGDRIAYDYYEAQGPDIMAEELDMVKLSEKPEHVIFACRDVQSGDIEVEVADLKNLFSYWGDDGYSQEDEYEITRVFYKTP